MLFTDMLDPEIIHHKSECDGPQYVPPQARSVDALVIHVGGESFSDKFVGKDPSLWEPPVSAHTHCVHIR